MLEFATMTWRSIAAIIMAGAFSVGCHSTTTPSPTATAEPALTFKVTTTATLSRLGQQWQIDYLSCFTVQAPSGDVAAMIVNRVDYMLLDGAAQVYRSFSDVNSPNVGRPIGQTSGGCAKTVDLDTARPVAPAFRAVIQFGDGSRSYSRSLDGTVVNNVPPAPFIDSLTLTNDIPGAQHILFSRSPITFTVTQVRGGTPPFSYLFKINGFVMRDWNTNPVWVWDAQTLNNAPTVSGGYTCAVNVRQGSFPSEAIATTDFTLVLPLTTESSSVLSYDLGQYLLATAASHEPRPTATRSTRFVVR